MRKMLAVPFEYNKKEFCTLVRVKPGMEQTELEVTIMNGDLERMLYGNHVFHYKNGDLIADIPAKEKEKALLQLQIGQALKNYIHLNPLDTN